VSRTSEIREGILHSKNFSKALELNFERSRIPTRWTVQAFRETQASDPRDKFFGLLGISG
jgi:hypothetical protein